ncbi:hypothetical protein BpHYR1_051381 [Brachionus plicatilis]|uniref:Uncharacterized protein n=1 Tax=Brachionus plicatilis TaxID=10195 RepID=A0A3M7PRJ9_BRAPC|nr:hypothetical protein BpHYR1_051381 [Brachionus plicatilis]
MHMPPKIQKCTSKLISLSCLANPSLYSSNYREFDALQDCCIGSGLKSYRLINMFLNKLRLKNSNQGNSKI